ncbi:MAG: hypothetical protein HY856_08820 [Burkholderiales bacterium]|nr:hypothetical protein [Burkholderiales bacterium]
MSGWGTVRLVLAVTCFVWVAVLWHWQSTQHDMSVRDVLVHLVAMPLTVALLMRAAVWAWEGAVARMGSASAVAASAPALAQTTGGQAMPDDRAAVRVCVQAVSVRCAAGTSVEQVAAAMHDQAPRPRLDAQLRDADGLPVMAARVPGLGPGSATVADPAARSEPPSAALGRAGRLMQAVVDEIACNVGPLVEPTDEAPAAAHNPVVRVLSVWPAELTPAERGWARQRVGACVQGLAAQHPDVSWHALDVSFSTGVAAWLDAQRLLHMLHRQQRNDAVLVVACHSDIDATAIDRMHRAGHLFSSARPAGRVPGEGAVALWLAPLAQVGAPPPTHRPMTALPTLAWVRGVAHGRHDTPVDDRGRARAGLAVELVQQASARAATGAMAMAGIVSDADHRSGCAGESFAAALACLPHSDLADTHLAAGALTGHLGPVAPLLAVAMAAHQAASTGQLWAALSVADDHERLAVRLDPPADPSDTDGHTAPA